MREINSLSVQQWLCSVISDSQQPTSPIGFLFLKLPPPPCAVLLVFIYNYIYIYIDRSIYDVCVMFKTWVSCSFWGMGINPLMAIYTAGSIGDILDGGDL